MKDITAALAVHASAAGRTGENLEKCISLASRAADKGAEIILFPEMNITGYTSKKNPLISGEVIPGPITTALSRFAVKRSVTLLAGMAETDKQGRYFASQVAALPCGTLQVYRKIHISPAEKNFLTPGNHIKIIQLPDHDIKLGMALCYDAHFPELFLAMALKGADIILIPHASPFGTPDEKFRSWMRHLRARAFDNGVFVLACNQTGENHSGLTFPGLAVALGPDGRIIGKRLDNTEGILVVRLEQQTIESVRNHRMKYFLPSRRNDLFNFI
ncbi:MAG: nitrilase-related carbon-nitrogen hydrolase [Desulfobacteraceae bacterium]